MPSMGCGMTISDFSVVIDKEKVNDRILNNVELPIQLKNNNSLPLFDIFNDVIKILHEEEHLILPDFGPDPNATIYSDYSDDKKSLYEVYTFTIVDNRSNCEFMKNIKIIRHKYGLASHEISYKDRKKSWTERSLDDFLIICNNQLSGLILTVLVDKNIKSLFGQKNQNTLKEIEKSFHKHGNKVKGKIAEKTLRILLIIAYLVRLLYRKKGSITWLTDRDQITEMNQEVLGKMFAYALNCTKGAKKHEVYFMNPDTFQTDNIFRDILSISDLVAGSLMSWYRETNFPQIECDEFTIKIIKWLSAHGIGLKKFALKISQSEQNHLCFIGHSIRVFTEKSLENTVFIDIPLAINLETQT